MITPKLAIGLTAGGVAAAVGLTAAHKEIQAKHAGATVDDTSRGLIDYFDHNRDGSVELDHSSGPIYTDERVTSYREKDGADVATVANEWVLQWQPLINRADTDGDRKVTAAELAVQVKAYDANGDGAINGSLFGTSELDRLTDENRKVMRYSDLDYTARPGD